jgi:tetratricopeptide (TPR) repeat protein
MPPNAERSGLMEESAGEHQSWWPVTNAQSALIADELGRVLRSEPFQRSPRHRRFLSFIVEQSLRGKAHEIKELTLAATVFGRIASGFDAQRDPIVRVEAARLRDKLAHYYASHGADSRLRIVIPKGSYRPLFVQAGDEAALAPADASRGRTTAGIGVDASAARGTQRTSLLLTRDDRARDCYQRGRYAAQQHDAAACSRALDLFRQAIAIDQGFANAHAALAMVLVELAGLVVMPSGALSAEAKKAAQRALALDPTSADAQVALGVCAHRFERDWAAAETIFRHAVARDPESANAHSALGYALTTRGLRAEAAEHLRRARELDPLNVGLRASFGQSATYWRQFAQAKELLTAVLEMAPRHAFAEFALGLNALYAGDWQLARDALWRAIAMSPEDPSPRLCTVAALAAEGRTQDAHDHLVSTLDRFSAQYLCRYHLAIANAYLGDRQGMYAALEQAVETNDYMLVNLPVEPAFDAYHADKRFQTFLARNGLASLEQIAAATDPARRAQ